MTILKPSLLLCFSLLFFLKSFSQQKLDFEDVIAKYESYSELPRELVFLHSNKTTYIKGEQLGFTAYVLDKKAKRLSVETTNLYVTISDSDNQILKQKMLLVDKGIAIGDFEIDSLFTSGNYQLRAYTNWMRNFDEQNSFVAAIKVLDVELEDKKLASKEVRATLNAQFLPEGGHLLSDVENIIGVAVKDSLGFGLPNLQGEIKDEKGTLITTFKTNHLGLGKFQLLSEKDKKYTGFLNFNGIDFSFPIKDARSIGIAMQLVDEKNKLILQLRTNSESLSQLQTNSYFMGIHTGSAMKVVALPRFENTNVIQVIPKKLLYSGMNILTLFDSNNNPILERLYFNKVGLEFLGSTNSNATINTDSTLISIQYKNIDSLSNFSVSVLPAASISNLPHHTMASYTLVQPYIKGAMENGAYYFQDQNEAKVKDLDLLLLTQGWSSYEWNTVFNHPPKVDYDFENGISANIISDGEKDRDFFLYPFIGIEAMPINIREGETTLEVEGLFPFEDDSLRISSLRGRKGKIRPALNLNVIFQPIQIPKIDTDSRFLFQKEQILLKATNSFSELVLRKGVEELNEVVVTKEIRDLELEKIQALSFGEVEAFTDNNRRSYGNFLNYIANNGFKVVSSSAFGDFIIVNRVPTGSNNPPPFIYLDGLIMSTNEGYRSLSTLNLNDVAYIDINKFGLGEGLRGAGGVIRIYSRANYSSEKPKSFRPVYAEYDFPLTFTKEQKFYVPKYASYNSNFYEFYGTLGWFPKLKPNLDGTINFKIANTELTSVKLFVEGITNDGKFVSEVIALPLEQR